MAMARAETECPLRSSAKMSADQRLKLKTKFMNEEPKSIWRKKFRLPRFFLAWLGLGLVAAISWAMVG